MKGVAAGPYDIWIQAASGGESILADMILNQLAAIPSGPQKKLRILLTSGTKEGVDTLSRAATGNNHILAITVSYFPFDAPYLMKRAFTVFSPRLAVIIETELWPGFLINAKRHNIPVLLLNGRISEKSFRFYRNWPSFFSTYGPKYILAISTGDQDRFARLVGTRRVSLMNNIKFDKVQFNTSVENNNLISRILPTNHPFVVLGSVRREEENKIITVIDRLLAERPDIVIGLFPKHVARANILLQLLKSKKINAAARTSAATPVPPGTVIIWDVFGELAGAYSHAKTTFVGGSLVDLGGQNFLEPLVFGVKPIIGPFWRDFAWIGREIIELGLVHEVADEQQLTQTLLRKINSNESKEDVLSQVQQFLTPRRGGTLQACRLISDTLNSVIENNEP